MFPGIVYLNAACTSVEDVRLFGSEGDEISASRMLGAAAGGGSTGSSSDSNAGGHANSHANGNADANGHSNPNSHSSPSSDHSSGHSSPNADTTNPLNPQIYQYYLGFVLFLFGSIYSLSYELQRFAWKARPENKGRLHTEYLASVSIHPNYFGDLFSFTGWNLIVSTYCALAASAGMLWTFLVI
jgi:hypothetical protein